MLIIWFQFPRIISCPPPRFGDLDIKFVLMDHKLRVEQFHLIDAQQQEKLVNGKIFREQLDKSERKAFDEMMAYPHLYNAAGVTACKTVLIQPILMSIIFEHYKQLDNIQNSIEKQK